MTNWTIGRVYPFELNANATVDEGLAKIATEYREAPLLIGLLRNMMIQPASLKQLAYAMLYKFDLNTAIGDQLTIIGHALGWPRYHCRGRRRLVFGFECAGDCPPTVPIGGFCDGSEWDCDGQPEYVPFTFTDDELYRRFVKARRWTVFREYAHDGLAQSIKDAFGPQAIILEDGAGVVKVATQRLLTPIELSIARLYEQCLPIAPGVRLEIYHSNGPVWGYGQGWGEFCQGYWPTRIET